MQERRARRPGSATIPLGHRPSRSRASRANRCPAGQRRRRPRATRSRRRTRRLDRTRRREDRRASEPGDRGGEHRRPAGEVRRRTGEGAALQLHLRRHAKHKIVPHALQPQSWPGDHSKGRLDRSSTGGSPARKGCRCLSANVAVDRCCCLPGSASAGGSTRSSCRWHRSAARTSPPRRGSGDALVWK